MRFNICDHLENVLSLKKNKTKTLRAPNTPWLKWIMWFAGATFDEVISGSLEIDVSLAPCVCVCVCEQLSVNVYSAACVHIQMNHRSQKELDELQETQRRFSELWKYD